MDGRACGGKKVHVSAPSPLPCLPDGPRGRPRRPEAEKGADEGHVWTLFCEQQELSRGFQVADDKSKEASGCRVGEGWLGAMQLGIGNKSSRGASSRSSRGRRQSRNHSEVDLADLGFGWEEGERED